MAITLECDSAVQTGFLRFVTRREKRERSARKREKVSAVISAAEKPPSPALRHHA